ncbi:MAG TPA: 3-hydroxyacyl-CoA dehydrogenase family protein [Waddliaceae bacterium]
MLKESLKQVSVLGAAGKMGRGISLLLLQEMARTEAELTGNVGRGIFRLHLFDSNDEGLIVLKKYLLTQLHRYAKKNINRLREYFSSNSNLISNEDIIRTFVQRGLDIVYLDSEIASSKNSTMIFEAVIEDIQIKTELFSKLRAIGRKDAYYFTNTSSIPIHHLSKKSGLEHRLIGYHFYNPPEIQKLIEIIIPAKSNPTLESLALELTQRFGKIAVLSNDIAGFIGNGHFIREIDYACRKVQELEKKFSREQAITMLDNVTREFLLRPMGIFQLIDYVGIDVCQKVMSIMGEFLHLSFSRELVDTMINKEKKGGQNPDGSQRDGFFSYQQRKPAKIFDDKTHTYISIPNDSLGPLPSGHISWKKLNEINDKEEILRNHFSSLFSSSTFGAKIAQSYLWHSREIARNLIKNGVAKSVEDVNTVLMNGFYHPYGIENAWIPEKTTQK